MNQSQCLLYQFLIFIIPIILTSCSSDDESIVNVDVTGYWYGEHQYYNPVSGVKKQYLSMNFYSNGTGQLEYEASDSHSISYFTYTVSGSTITCKGAHANTGDGNVDIDFEMTLKIENDRLIPLTKYTTFILTRDGSVITDGNGNEVVNYSKWLHGVWLRRDSPQILCLNSDNTYDEYVLPYQGSTTCTKHISGTYDYNPAQKWLTVNGNRYIIRELLEVSLGIETISGEIRWYDKGTEADVPDTSDITGTLVHPLGWSTIDNSRTFIFTERGTVTYLEQGKKIASYGTVILWATGNYTISANQVKCNYNDVDWEYSSSYPNMFLGWVAGKATIKNYTVELLDNSLRITDDSGAGQYYYAN